ncbi:hypothetical protein CSW25_04940 [Thermus scotoductus]|uniref:Uncharacterized protein n=1 Tax=Thermus scotoductus TaxID=37636 RepID=A0A430RFD4_THESC|nr:hypothetical protein [Thermus scotoductus]RTG97851.1 hypothetical protein CSW49_02110 [Thermus scotoductus]RTH06365.1 hypothetical protein CSW45_01870 [Thermus scotoductus]RTH11930.1 hypothetical protein CSW46_03340 [Thermus scotoductus]RTH13004.1 hypothetical protein CSW44_02860 [Thermus scotoductus]RTH19802.1 hypothetical protein CSW39_01775 [Thermus scotoductus]
MGTFEAHIRAIAHTDGGALDLSDYVLSYADRHPVQGMGTWSLSLPLYIRGKPVTSLLRTGDVLEVGLLAWDGKKGPWGRGSYQTVMLGVIRSIGQRQALAPGGLTQVAVLSGSHLAGVLLGDAVNYYLAYGSLYGLFRGIAMTGLKGVTRLDQGLAHYLSQVAFEVAQIVRPYGGIRDLLSYALHTVDGEGAFDLMFANYEGTLWGFLEAYAERPLHELYAAILPQDRLGLLKGVKHLGKTFGEDHARAVIVLRPAPFPYGLPGGGGTLGEWPSLPLHDLEGGFEPTEDHTADWSDADVKNAFYVHPRILPLDETVVITYAPAILNLDSWRRYGYRPLTWATWLWGSTANKEVAPEFFSRLNWRIAGQHNRMDEYAGAELTVRLSPHIRPGERVRVENRLGDRTSVFLYYVEEVRHTWTPTGPWTTTLRVSRGLPEAVYRDAGWFVEGLREYSPLKDALFPVPTIRKEDSPGPTAPLKKHPHP